MQKWVPEDSPLTYIYTYAKKGTDTHHTNQQQKKPGMMGKTLTYTNKELSSEVKFAKWETDRDRGRSKTARKRETKDFSKEMTTTLYSFALKVKKIARLKKKGQIHTHTCACTHTQIMKCKIKFT